MSFVVLARLTRSQAATAVAAPSPSSAAAELEQQQLVKEEEVGVREGGVVAGDALPADKVKWSPILLLSTGNEMCFPVLPLNI